MARFEALRGSCAGEPWPSEAPGPCALGLRHPMTDTLVPGCPHLPRLQACRSKLRVSATACIRSRRGGGEARWCTVTARGNQELVLEIMVSKC